MNKEIERGNPRLCGEVVFVVRIVGRYIVLTHDAAHGWRCMGMKSTVARGDGSLWCGSWLLSASRSNRDGGMLSGIAVGCGREKYLWRDEGDLRSGR